MEPHIHTVGIKVLLTNEATDLFAGTHMTNVTDDNGCSDQISATIGEPDALSISDLTPDSIICADINLQATGNGGSSTYIYSWTANGSSIDVGQPLQSTQLQIIHNIA